MISCIFKEKRCFFYKIKSTEIKANQKSTEIKANQKGTEIKANQKSLYLYTYTSYNYKLKD